MAALRLGPHQKGVLKWLSLLCKVGGNALAGRALRQLSVKARALGKMRGSLVQLLFHFVGRGRFAARVPKNDGTVVKWFLQVSKMRAGSLARDGDCLMTQLQRAKFHFCNIQGRDPELGNWMGALFERRAPRWTHFGRRKVLQ